MPADDERPAFAIESSVDDPPSVDTGGEGDEKPDPNQETGDPLKDTQRWAHKLADENKTLKAQLDEMNGKLNLLAQINKPAEKPTEPETIPDPLGGFKEEDAATLLEDPKKLVSLMRQMAQRNDELLIKVLKHRDQDLLGHITKMIPKDEGREAVLSEMRKDPDLRGLDDNTLLIIAKKMGRAEPRGGLSGRRTDGGGSSTEVEKAALSYEELIYGKRPKGEQK